ncbi:ABC transporter substrate-binding protein [Actinomycetota bacterium]|nr:ABC transporter substrate-binding protein [Actinomycetota bacterium]
MKKNGVLAIIVALVVIIAGISIAVWNNGQSEVKTNALGEPCAKTYSVVVTVDQWLSVAKDLAIDCVDVTAIINGTGIDPHEYEPHPSDLTKLENADLVVMNGLGYDEWAAKATANSKERQLVLDISDAAHTSGGANPHLWYSSDVIKSYIDSFALYESAMLSQSLDVNSQSVLDSVRQKESELSIKFSELVMLQDQIKTNLAGKKYAATESVAYYLMNSLGVEDLTPLGYVNATTNEGEPSILDITEFENLIKDPETPLSFLVYNTQEESDISTRIRDATQNTGVVVVNVTEQKPAEYDDLFDWITAVAKSFDGGHPDLMPIAPPTTGFGGL